MPTYQYACTVDQCGHEFDTVQAFTDDALTDCPECTGRLRKVWGSIGVVFKGSGFYRNDSREAEKSGRKKDAKESSSSSDSGSKSTDKPAATTSEKSSTTPAPAKANGSTSSTSSAAAAS